MIDYISRYGLEWNPFIKGNKESLVVTGEYNEVQSRLEYLRQIKGFGLLTGNPGLGKTTAVRNWAKNLSKTENKVIYISLSTVTVLEFYQMLAGELGYEPAFRKYNNFKIIQEGINRYVIEKRMTPVIILDEANYLKSATLNDLKILFNFEYDSINKAVILLTGLPQLNNTLHLASHEPLAQRIVMNYEMNTLTKEDIKRYIKEKFESAGCHVKIYQENALEAIANASNGIPRMIDKIVNQSLIVGNILNENLISADTIMKVMEEIQL